LQNYAAAGAVILAYYTSKINIKVAAPAVIVLGFVFTWGSGATSRVINAAEASERSTHNDTARLAA
jgi:hypothetical protein